MSDAAYQELRRRLQTLEDIEQIKRLKARYLNACDAQDPQTARDCFAQGEVLIDMGHVGVFHRREEFEALYRAAGCHPHMLDMHHGANCDVEILDETHARGLWALDYRNINTREKTVTFLSTVYRDEYTKIDGDWRITVSCSEFKTVLHCSYASGTLEAVLTGKSLASS